MKVLEINGCVNCPMSDMNDMSSGYSCQLYRQMNPPGYKIGDNFIHEDPETFQPITPSWCPIKGDGLTLKAKEVDKNIVTLKYKKIPIHGYISLGMYPVYCDDLYWGNEPFKIVGIRENEIEIEGDFSGGTHNVTQRDWINVEKIFAVTTVCKEQIKPGGCQVHNVTCCGGGSVIEKHERYWDNLID